MEGVSSVGVRHKAVTLGFVTFSGQRSLFCVCVVFQKSENGNLLNEYGYK